MTANSQCPWILTSRDTSTTWVGAAKNGATVSDTINLVSLDSYALDPHPANTPRTAAGIGLGSRRSEVVAAYPTARPVSLTGAGFALRYSEDAGSMVFVGRGDIVESIQVVPTAGSPSSEYCG